MTNAFLHRLQVVVTGVDAAIARDVARLAAAEGASVLAADRDAAKLSRLQRDLGLYRTQIETAPVDLASPAEVRLWEQSLRALGRLPHVLICCCSSPESAAAPSGRKRPAGPGQDVGLSEARRRRCPADIAARTLQPTLFLHAEATRRSAFDRAIAVLRHPTLRGLLERAPGRGPFSPDRVIPYVRIADQIYSLRRLVGGEAPPRARIRLMPPDDVPPTRADAA